MVGKRQTDTCRGNNRITLLRAKQNSSPVSLQTSTFSHTDIDTDADNDNDNDDNNQEPITWNVQLSFIQTFLQTGPVSGFNSVKQVSSSLHEHASERKINMTSGYGYYSNMASGLVTIILTWHWAQPPFIWADKLQQCIDLSE